MGVETSEHEIRDMDKPSCQASLAGGLESELELASSIQTNHQIREILIALQNQIGDCRVRDKQQTYELLGQAMAKITVLSGQTNEAVQPVLNFLNSCRRTALQKNPDAVFELLGALNSGWAAAGRAEELKERFFDARLEYLLYKYCEKINEGQNGVIFKLDSRTLPASIRKKLAEFGFDEQTNQNSAIKILKLYSPEKAEYELEMQKRAHQIVQASKKPESELSQIPRPAFAHELEIKNPKVIEKLTRAGVLPQRMTKLTDEETPEKSLKVSLLVMDFVPGDDLATFFYKWVLRKKGRDEKSLERLGFRDLHMLVGEELGFEIPSPGADQTLTLTVSFANSKKLFSYLESAGFKANPQLITQIQNTTRLLHNNDLYHNDLTWRNIMADGSIEQPNSKDAKEVRSWIIDFEYAGNAPSGNYEDNTVPMVLSKKFQPGNRVAR